MCIELPWSVAIITGSDELSPTIWKYYNVNEGLFIRHSAVKWSLGPSSFEMSLAVSVSGTVLPAEEKINVN